MLGLVAHGDELRPKALVELLPSSFVVHEAVLDVLLSIIAETEVQEEDAELLLLEEHLLGFETVGVHGVSYHVELSHWVDFVDQLLDACLGVNVTQDNPEDGREPVVHLVVRVEELFEVVLQVKLGLFHEQLSAVRIHKRVKSTLLSAESELAIVENHLQSAFGRYFLRFEPPPVDVGLREVLVEVSHHPEQSPMVEEVEVRLVIWSHGIGVGLLPTALALGLLRVRLSSMLILKLHGTI